MNGLIRIVFMSAMIAPLGGCFVTSLEPLDDGTAGTADSSFVGAWTMKCAAALPTDTCHAMVSAKQGGGYWVAYTDEHGETISFTVGVVRLGKERYADASIAELSEKQSEGIPLAVLSHMAPAHSIWKMSGRGDELTFRWMDAKAIAPFAGKEIRLKDPWEDRDTPLIVSSSKELQEFVRKHGDQVFTGEPWVWHHATNQ